MIISRIALHKSPLILLDLLPVFANNGLVDWLAGLVLDRSVAHFQTLLQQHQVFVLLALQIADECRQMDNQFVYHSSRLIIAVVLRLVKIGKSDSCWLDWLQFPLVMFENAPAFC